MEKLKGNELVLQKLQKHVDQLFELSSKLVVFGKKEPYERIKIKIDEVEQAIYDIKYEQDLPSNFID